MEDELVETFVPVRDHPNYEISNHGRIMSVRRRQMLKPRWDTKGYGIVKFHSGLPNKALHRVVAQHFIPNPDNLKYVDHIDGDKTNNRIDNLRWCTRSQNNCNVSRKTSGTNNYKGVCFVKGVNKWRVQITFNYKQHHLGYFITEEEAARKYDEAARELHGEFAKINFPE